MAQSELRGETHYFKQAEFFTHRTILNGNQICFAASSGHNDQPHNHNDVGNFILNVNGDNLLTDLGMGLYNAQCFGEQRYSILNNGSQGHSVPIIEDMVQQAGREYCSNVLSVENDEQRKVFKIDIAKAYNLKNLKSLVREFEFVEDENAKLILKDTYFFEKEPSKVVERFVTKFEPEIVREGEIILQGQQGRIRIVYDKDCLTFIPEKAEYYNRLGEIEKVNFIDFEVKKERLSKELNIKIVFYVAP